MAPSAPSSTSSPWLNSSPLGPWPLKHSRQQRSGQSRKRRRCITSPRGRNLHTSLFKKDRKSNCQARGYQSMVHYSAANYTELSIKHPSNTNKLHFKRAALGRILAARSQHGDFAAYHQRLNHNNATLNCSCGRPKSPLHFFYCKLSTVRKLTHGNPASEAIQIGRA